MDSSMEIAEEDDEDYVSLLTLLFIFCFGQERPTEVIVAWSNFNSP